MNIRVHISRPKITTKIPGKRVWILSSDICRKCVHLLGGNLQDPKSVAIRKGYRTQSQNTIPLKDLLVSLGREYIEVPKGKKIHYKKALMQGYEYIFEQLDGAWTFESISNILLSGYSREEFLIDDRDIYSTGIMRKVPMRNADDSTRYLIKYTDEKRKYADIYDVLEFERDPKEAQKKCESSDELAQMIF